MCVFVVLFLLFALDIITYVVVFSICLVFAFSVNMLVVLVCGVGVVCFLFSICVFDLAILLCVAGVC